MKEIVYGCVAHGGDEGIIPNYHPHEDMYTINIVEVHITAFIFLSKQTFNLDVNYALEPSKIFYLYLYLVKIQVAQGSVYSSGSELTE